MESQVLKEKLGKLDNLLEKMRATKVEDEKLLVSAREELKRLETQLGKHREDAESAKTLLAKEKKSLGLRLLQEGAEAYAEIEQEIEKLASKQADADAAISQLEAEKNSVLVQFSELRLRSEIPPEQESLHREGGNFYQQFKQAFSECQKAHANMKRVAGDLRELGREYENLNKRTGYKFPHLKFDLCTPFVSGAGVRFFDDFKTFVERQATMVADGRVRLE